MKLWINLSAPKEKNNVFKIISLQILGWQTMRNNNMRLFHNWKMSNLKIKNPDQQQAAKQNFEILF